MSLRDAEAKLDRARRRSEQYPQSDEATIALVRAEKAYERAWSQSNPDRKEQDHASSRQS